MQRRAETGAWIKRLGGCLVLVISILAISGQMTVDAKGKHKGKHGHVVSEAARHQGHNYHADSDSHRHKHKDHHGHNSGHHDHDSDGIGVGLHIGPDGVSIGVEID